MLKELHGTRSRIDRAGSTPLLAGAQTENASSEAGRVPETVSSPFVAVAEHSAVAQLERRLAVNQDVAGSGPASRAKMKGTQEPQGGRRKRGLSKLTAFLRHNKSEAALT